MYTWKSYQDSWKSKRIPTLEICSGPPPAAGNLPRAASGGLEICFGPPPAAGNFGNLDFGAIWKSCKARTCTSTRLIVDKSL